MDKYEYRQRAEEIRELINEKEYVAAMRVADTIDWSRVKSVDMLTLVSDIYKINKRFDHCRDVLALAYERCPGSRSILYSLCDVSIRLGDYVQAVEYYKEFVRSAPNDSGRYILLYKLYEAQGVSLEERIEVLKEFKEKDRREKWWFELAYLYHQTGQVTRCVEECDEMILWIGTGKYVMKAMELKMLHEPLTPTQQEMYEQAHRRALLNRAAKLAQNQEETAPEEPHSVTDDTDEIEIKTFDVDNKFNTIDIQAEIARNMEDLMRGSENQSQGGVTFDTIEREVIREFMSDEQTPAQDAEAETPEPVQETMFATMSDPDAALATAPLKEAKPVTNPMLNEDGEVIHDNPMTLVDMHEEVPERFADKLTQDYDGQISMVVPDSTLIEKQITGQLNIEDILAEWEKTKEELAKKREEELSRMLRDQTRVMMYGFSVVDNNATLAEMEAVADAEIARQNIARWENADEDSTITETMEDVDPSLVDGGEETSAETEIEEVTEESVEEPAEESAEAPSETAPEEMAEEHPEDADDGVEEIAEEPVSVPAEEVAEEETSEEEITEEPAPAPAEEEEEEEEGPVREHRVPGLDFTGEMGDISEALSEEEALAEDSAESNPAESASEESTSEESTSEEGVSGENDENASENSESENASEENGSEKSAPSSFKAAINPKVSLDKDSNISEDEKAFFGHTVSSDNMKKQITLALEKMSLASYTGNVMITGDKDAETTSVAKTLIKNFQANEENFSGKVAKITGEALNRKDIEMVLSKLDNGALIVERCGDMDENAVKKMIRYINNEGKGILIVLCDSKRAMRKLIIIDHRIQEYFNARINIAMLDAQALARYGKKYAYEKEYGIDDLGMLALQQRIDELSAGKKSVTLAQVRELVDEAIWSANRKNLRHFWALLSSKRYDAEDMIILRERDFE